MPLAITDLVYRNATVDFDGKGSQLTSLEGDYNNFKLATGVVDLQVLMASVGAGIVSGTQDTPTTFSFTLSDATVIGPFTIPTTAFNGRGEWQPSVSYAVNDMVYYGTGIYIVEVAHVSDTTFDPNATDGNANDLYGLVFDIAGAGSAVRTTTFKTEANLTHTLTSLDPGAIWDCTNAGGCVVTIPDDSTYDAPLDTEVSFRQGTVAGIVSFVTAGSATLDTGMFQPNTTYHGATVMIKKSAANVWIGIGYLSA